MLLDSVLNSGSAKNGRKKKKKDGEGARGAFERQLLVGRMGFSALCCRVKTTVYNLHFRKDSSSFREKAEMV